MADRCAKEKSGNPPLRGRKGPSLAALASLTTLALSLWLEVELSSALLRAVLVYLGLALLTLAYRALLGHYLVVSEQRARDELLQRIQREAEEEAQKEAQKKELAQREATSRENLAKENKSAPKKAKEVKETAGV